MGKSLISYLKKKKQLNSLQKIENKFINQISDLEHKNLLLTEKLDLDYIETLIRQKFLFGKKNEIIYIIKKNEN